MEKLTHLKNLLGQVNDLQSAAAVLEWDQETYMPAGAAQARAQQISTLRQLAHEQFTSDEVGTLLDALSGATEGADAALVKVTQRDYNRVSNLPSALVAEEAGAIALGKQAWKEARETDTFSTFAPKLAHLIEIAQKKAEAFGYTDSPYDALLDQYEPGMKTAEVAAVFSSLRDELVPIVQEITARPAPDDSVLFKAYDPQKQWDFGLDVIKDFGYDFNCGRQDRSAHPFTTSFAISDVRVTTRIYEAFFPTGLFGTLHEAGHGLYEQGINPAFDRTPLAEGTSLGMHESQSRLWENQIGRSRPFWVHYYPKLQSIFPEQLGDVTLDAFYRAINKVSPSLIRVEADEVTYNLHIMLRFELEQAMVAGEIATEDLPAAWNDRMEAYLGIRPDSDANGVLQDIHWSLGALGYFPTYALGNLMSAMLFEQAQKDLPELEAQVSTGQFAPLLSWLRTHIHQHGKAKDAGEILKEVTGQELSADAWLAYVRGKFV